MNTKKQLQKELITFMDKYEISAALVAQLLGYTNKNYIYGKRSGTHKITADEIIELKRSYYCWFKKKFDNFYNDMKSEGLL